jgi:hypothetical protein
VVAVKVLLGVALAMKQLAQEVEMVRLLLLLEHQ